METGEAYQNTKYLALFQNYKAKTLEQQKACDHLQDLFGDALTDAVLQVWSPALLYWKDAFDNYIAAGCLEKIPSSSGFSYKQPDGVIITPEMAQEAYRQAKNSEALSLVNLKSAKGDELSIAYAKWQQSFEGHRQARVIALMVCGDITE